MHTEDWQNDPFGVSDPVMMNVFDEYQYYAKGIKWNICGVMFVAFFVITWW